MHRFYAALLLAALTAPAPAYEGPESMTDFSRGKWDETKWTPLRLAEQPSPGKFAQADDAITAGPFTEEQKIDSGDNVLMMTDTGLAEGQADVTFSIGQSGHAAPGIFLAPVVENGVFKDCVCVFAATYTLAVWRLHVDPKTGKTEYLSLGRLSRWTTPGDKHVLRCRWSKSGKKIALQLDSSDIVVLEGLGDAIDGRMGLWGCHDACSYYSMSVTTKPTLEWNAKAPK